MSDVPHMHADGTVHWPVVGGDTHISSVIGDPRDGGARRHRGVDIGAPIGTPIVAAVGGEVIRVGDAGGNAGVRVTIRDANGNDHAYLHMQTHAPLQVGDTVAGGQYIGTVGASGNADESWPHLHYSINETRGDELIDPEEFLAGAQFLDNIDQAPQSASGGSFVVPEETPVDVGPFDRNLPVAEGAEPLPQPDSNDSLGGWILNIREPLKNGRWVDIGTATVILTRAFKRPPTAYELLVYARINELDLVTKDPNAGGEYIMNVSQVATSINSEGRTLDIVRPDETASPITNDDYILTLPENVRGALIQGGFDVDENASITAAELTSFLVSIHGPEAAYWMSVPEVRDVLIQATIEEWDAARTKGAVESTNWWQTTQSSVRQWEADKARDPASVQAQVEQRIFEMQAEAERLGVPIPGFASADLAEFAESSLAQAMTPQQWRNGLIGLSDSIAQRAARGEFGEGNRPVDDAIGQIPTDAATLRMTADAYMVAPTDTQLNEWATRIAEGTATQQDFRAHMAKIAQSTYSHLDGIDIDVATEDLFSQHRQVLAEELDLDVDSVRMADPKWAEVVTTSDGKNFKAMNTREARLWSRNLPEWEFSTSAHNQADQLINELARAFGQR